MSYSTLFILVTIPLLGHDSLDLWALVAIAAVVPVCKLAGLYDRDQHLLRKTRFTSEIEAGSARLLSAELRSSPSWPTWTWQANPPVRPLYRRPTPSRS